LTTARFGLDLPEEIVGHDETRPAIPGPAFWGSAQIE
jgi:hypothetical protein